MKKRADEFVRAVEFLKTSDYGSFVENEETGNMVVIESMVGGRYLCLDADREVVMLTNSEKEVCAFLFESEQVAQQS